MSLEKESVTLPVEEEGQKDENTEKEKSFPEEALSIEETLQNEIHHLKDQLLRSLADTENLRKRTQREKEEARQYAITHFARDLLSIADNLDRALKVLPEAEEVLTSSLKSLREGVQLTQREVEGIFSRHGIKRISPLGEKFNHDFHQAMFENESDEEAGTITQVLQDGYILHDRLLRPAMVGVAKARDKSCAADAKDEKSS